jgi:hypothetical protein
MTIYVSHVDTADASMDTPTRHCTISRDHHGGGRKRGQKRNEPYTFHGFSPVFKLTLIRN